MLSSEVWDYYKQPGENILLEVYMRCQKNININYHNATDFSFMTVKLVCYGRTYLTFFHIYKSLSKMLIIRKNKRRLSVLPELPEHHWHFNSVLSLLHFYWVLRQNGYTCTFSLKHGKNKTNIIIKAWMKLHDLIFGLYYTIIRLLMDDPQFRVGGKTKQNTKKQNKTTQTNMKRNT